jgi:hypothetical protein
VGWGYCVISIGLSAADHAAFEATLVQSHRMRTVVQIHDNNEQVIYTFGAKIISGSVQVDWTQSGGKPIIGKDPYVAPSGPVRTLDIVTMRPDKDQVWLPSSPGDEVAWVGNFISAKYGVFVEDLSDGPGWVDIPVFWGPITEIDQDGAQFEIKASGKEVLGMDPCLLWDTINVSKGTQRTNAIRKLFDSIGENRYHLPESSDRMAWNMSYNRYSQPWLDASKIAHDGNMQLFYDGYGRLHLRDWPKNRVWTFKDGANGSVLSRPTITYDVSQTRNLIEVMGGTPKGSKTQIRAVAKAAASSPLSGQNLGRNGQPRWMVYTETGNRTKQADAQQRADDLLFQYLQAAVTPTFDCLVIPHLEEGDTVAVEMDGNHFQFKLTQFTIPLTSDTNMTVGSNRRVAWKNRGKGRGTRTYLLGSQ